MNASRKLFKGEVLGYPTGSFDIVFDKLSDHIHSKKGKIHLENRVSKITLNSDNKFSLNIITKDGESTSLKYDYILATVPSFEFTKLINLTPSTG